MCVEIDYSLCVLSTATTMETIVQMYTCPLKWDPPTYPLFLPLLLLSDADIFLSRDEGISQTQLHMTNKQQVTVLSMRTATVIAVYVKIEFTQ